MEMKIITQGISDPPQLQNLPKPIIDLTNNQTMSVCVCEKGMVSGEPSVIIVSSDSEGSIFLQTSLDKFLTAASTMATIAENKFGWVRQEGHFTLLPPDKETRKKLLESIQKELQEWED